MKKRIFFELQLKRALRIYPSILIITIVTLLAIVVIAGCIVMQNQSSEDQQLIRVAVVGEINDTQLGLSVHVLQNLDSSRFFVEFPEMEENDAIEALKKREINGYIYIPDNFVEGIYYGENVPAQYVMLDAPEGLGSTLSAEVLGVVSNLVIEAQNANYSLRKIARNQGIRGSLASYTNEMNLDFVSFIINRNSTYEIKLVGVSDLLTMSGYFLCGIILFFLLIWGISCNKLLSGRNITLSRSLKAAGLNTFSQLLCEYSVFLIITFCTLQLFALFLGIATVNFDVGIYELRASTISSCMFFIIKIFPVIIMLTMMHMSIYELVPGTVSGILLQFFIALGLGYISGCFYPHYFFPETIQKISAILPSGAGFSYIRKVVSNTLSIKDLILPVLYTLLFALITFKARIRSMKGER